MSTSLEPETESERAVCSALMLLVNDRERVRVSANSLLTVCRASREFALRIIDRHRIALLNSSGTRSEEIAHLICDVEWELRGASEFLRCNHIVTPDYERFVHEKLLSSPSDFTREDLHSLLANNPRNEHPIRIAALDVLSDYVASFAERIAAEPPGLSQDVESLKQSIQSYGFNPDLNAILQKIDDALEKAADSFDQVSTIRHIRSFFEKVHENVGQELQRRKPNVGNGTPLHKCQQAIDYLERKEVITDKFQKLARDLYGILSDGTFGVHALKAERDYTRLCRNMVVEYSVTLFFELERRLAEPGDN